MPRSYPDEAIQHCLRLYLKYNGQQHDRIEADMRKLYPGWSKQNLYSRGKGKNEKLGWIDKFNWEGALKIHLAKTPLSALTAAEELVREVEEVRKALFARVKTSGAAPDKDLIYQHRDYCKLAIEAITKVEANRDTLGGFATFWERLMDWLPGIDEKAARALLKNSDAILERAAAEYGEDPKETAAVG